jgi:LPXTG-motif cell wall-anchored protein
MVTTDPDGDGVRYIITWGDESQKQDNDWFFPSGHSAQTSHQWTTWGFYTIQVYAQDNSTSNENKTSNVSELKVTIDAQYVGSLGYLINTDGIGPFDAFHSNLTGTQTAAQRQQTGIYLIDTNGDGKNDQQFDPSTNSLRPYPEGLSPSYTMLLVGLGVVILLLLLLGFLVRRRQKKT